MKKRIFGSILALALVLSALVVSIHAEGELSIPKATGSVTLDGNIDDAEWDGALVVDMNAKYPDYTNAFSKYKLMWDENFLYVGYCGVYVADLWNGKDWGGYVSGENCTITVMDSLTAETYTNHISMTPNLTEKVNAGAASVLNAPNLMSYHKDTGSGVYYPDNAKQTNNEWDLYTMEVKIPFGEINLDRSKTTAAAGDSFFMNINVYWAGQLLGVTDGTATVTLAAAPTGTGDTPDPGNNNPENNNDDNNPGTFDPMLTAAAIGLVMTGAALTLGKKRK